MAQAILAQGGFAQPFLACATSVMEAQSLSVLDAQHKVAQKRIQHIANWASILLLVCTTITVVAGWEWLQTGAHWYKSSIHAARLFLVLGLYAIAQSHFAKKFPCATMNACVIPLALIALSIMLENPEIEVHYSAILGGARQTLEQVFRWLEHVLPAAEFDAILAAASNATSGTSIPGAPLFPMSCVAQELRDGAPRVPDSHCHHHEAFAFNVIVGHAFLLSIAAHSGLTCRCCMASWLLSQLSSSLLLFAHDAPSLSAYFYSVVLSFFLCLSVSLWTEKDAKIGGIGGPCFPSRSYPSLSCESQSLMSSGFLAGTSLSDSESEGLESPSSMDKNACIVLEDSTLESISNLQKGSTVNPVSDMVIRMRSQAAETVDCWGPDDPGTETFQAGSIFNKFSSSVLSEASSGGAVDFKLGPRLARELALSHVLQIPQGMDGQLYSCGSRNHPHNCTPCWFHSRKKGCADGVLCGQCHYPHPEIRTSAKKKNAVKKRQELQQKQQQTNLAVCAIVQTVKNSFVEWVLQEEIELSPCMRRAHSAPALCPSYEGTTGRLFSDLASQTFFEASS